MATVQSLKKVVSFLQANSEQTFTLKSLREGTGLHFYPIRECVDFLDEIRFVKKEELGNQVRVTVLGDKFV